MIWSWKFALSHFGVVLSHYCTLLSILSPWLTHDTYW
jgi:hypothetical protein